MIVEMASGRATRSLGRAVISIASACRGGFAAARWAVSAAPGSSVAEDAARTLKALRRGSGGLDRAVPPKLPSSRWPRRSHCHAAVKANYPLTYEKMVHILAELAATSYSTICPHGRPVCCV